MLLCCNHVQQLHVLVPPMQPYIMHSFRKENSQFETNSNGRARVFNELAFFCRLGLAYRHTYRYRLCGEMYTTFHYTKPISIASCSV